MRVDEHNLFDPKVDLEPITAWFEELKERLDWRKLNVIWVAR